jgi:hypothetical protein
MARKGDKGDQGRIEENRKNGLGPKYRGLQMGGSEDDYPSALGEAKRHLRLPA